MRLFTILCILFGITFAQARDLPGAYDDAINSLASGEMDSARHKALTVLSYAKADGDELYLVKTYFLLGYIFAQSEEYGEAVIHYLEAARFAELQDDPEIKQTLISTYKNLGNIMGNYSHYDLAYQFIDKGIATSKNTGNLKQEISLYDNKIHEMLKDEQFEEALATIQFVFDSFELEEETIISLKNKAGIAARGINNDALAKEHYVYILDNADPSNLYYGYALHNIGEILVDQGHYQEAIGYFERSIQVEAEANDYSALINSYKELARMHMTMGSLSTGLDLLLDAASVDNSKYTKDPETHEIYSLLSEVNHRLGKDGEAFYYQKMYVDRLEAFIKQQQEIDELDKKYNIQLLTERYWEVLAANQERKETERMAQLGIGGTTGIFLLILAFIYFRQHHVRTSIQTEIKKIDAASLV